MGVGVKPQAAIVPDGCAALERDPQARRAVTRVERIEVLAASAEVVLELPHRPRVRRLDRAGRAEHRGDLLERKAEDLEHDERGARCDGQRAQGRAQADPPQLRLQHAQAARLAADERVLEPDRDRWIGPQQVVQALAVDRRLPALLAGQRLDDRREQRDEPGRVRRRRGLDLRGGAGLRAGHPRRERQRDAVFSRAPGRGVGGGGEHHGPEHATRRRRRLALRT